ncbi:GSCFA domain-containing protein [Nguyenibacter vanlangensis]|uniref:GSCFA domain-containing protein n=1 Tax=Nguyenibacter vanlangensis TaxID=1216886 RepID=A0A7Y7M4P1_9PROT|nr:GSCFA domain-containing protein [Nguyenibacter vanlangensis]NVN10177.1 GSCFA domain-containing protein [Nguyenibacter vanlangensis]
MVESITEVWRQERLHVAPEGQEPKIVGSAFYRGETCQFNPYHGDHAAPGFAERFLLQGWTPTTRFISSGTRITTFGSCFAQHINAHLKMIGFDTARDRDGGVYISLMGEGLVNVHSLLQQFEWALEDTAPPTGLWHGFKAESFGYDEAVRQRTREIFLSTDVFILTFGVSEIWYDEMTKGVFWRAVPMAHFDASRHKFRVASFAETRAAMERILDLIRKHVPEARVVMTVSPVPLVATFRPVSCITANSASKAIIRAALDEVQRERGDERLFYFPAYDAITTLFPQPFVEDGRHFHDFVVPAIMRLFEAFFCDTPLTREAAEAHLRAARLDCVRTLRDHPLYREAY